MRHTRFFLSLLAVVLLAYLCAAYLCAAYLCAAYLCAATSPSWPGCGPYRIHKPFPREETAELYGEKAAAEMELLLEQIGCNYDAKPSEVFWATISYHKGHDEHPAVRRWAGLFEMASTVVAQKVEGVKAMVASLRYRSGRGLTVSKSARNLSRAQRCGYQVLDFLGADVPKSMSRDGCRDLWAAIDQQGYMNDIMLFAKTSRLAVLLSQSSWLAKMLPGWPWGMQR